jgi:hypothetical protein
MRGAAALMLLGGLAACGPTGSDYCEDRRECMGGNEQDEEACNAYFDYVAELADVQGCADEFDEYFECFFDTAKCLTDDTGDDCASTDDCVHSGYGATCVNGSCQVKDLGLQGAEECANERMLYSQCSTLEGAAFGE